ncbi:MAG TPA: acylphosphatase [bacterium]|nr:acylphosphatase [bacterium]
MLSADVVRRRLLFSGVVQGVGFRYWAVRESAVFKVTGYVRNMYDGSLEAVLEGPRDEVLGFERVLRQGPPYGRIRRVDGIDEEPRGEFASFDVKF